LTTIAYIRRSTQYISGPHIVTKTTGLSMLETRSIDIPNHLPRPAKPAHGYRFHYR
jgi:hypothetical protein